MANVFMVLFLLTGVLLILLVLIQKGRGGGLAGAFGGPGGHSAFGTKTADVLTKLTAGLGALFFLLSIVTALFMGRTPAETDAARHETPGERAPAEPGGDAGPAGDEPLPEMPGGTPGDELQEAPLEAPPTVPDAGDEPADAD